MKTIAFYSYKGGVGRSLAVSNSAYYLSRQGKTVFILDMDFEAPGMHYKLEQYNQPIKPEKGIIDFLTTSRNQGKTDTALSQYTIKLESKEREMKDMWLMPAGDPMSRSYWEQMADIEWKDFLYNEEQVGVKLFWDLKHLIQEQYNPDFLLIDSRTGLTDLTGISLSLLADEIVMLAVNNPENIDGSRLVMEKLQRMASSADLKMPKLHFVLTRLPAPVKGKDRGLEAKIKSDVLKRLNKESVSPADNLVNQLYIIHIDPEQALGERLRFSEDTWEKYPIARDYVHLVSLFAELDSTHPFLRFQRLWESLQKAQSQDEEKEIATKLVQIETPIPSFELIRGYIARNFLNDQEQGIRACTNAIQLNPLDEAAYFNRGVANFDLGNYFAALDDCAKAIELDPQYAKAYNNRGYVHDQLKDYSAALADYAIAIELDPQYAKAYYNRGNTHDRLEDYPAALIDYTKAIEFAPQDAQAHYNRGMVYAELKDYPAALNDLNKVLELDPSHEPAQLNRANLFKLMKNKD